MRSSKTPDTDELIEFIQSTTGALFHMTDERNFPSIEQHGLLSKGEIQRLEIAPTNPGGNDLTWGLDQDYGLWDYVFAAFKRGGVMPKHDNEWERRPRTLLLDPELLRVPGVKIALGRANHSGTKAYCVEWAVRKMPHEHFVKYMSGTHDWANIHTRHHYFRIADYEIMIPKRVDPAYIIGSR